MEHWQKVMAVQHMQDYIAAHLNEPITLAVLAAKAGLTRIRRAMPHTRIYKRYDITYTACKRVSREGEMGEAI